jgi:hypothetical protein
VKRFAPRPATSFAVATLTSLDLLASGYGGSKPPAVANIATTSTPTTTAAKSTGNSPTTLPKGNAAQLLAEWAACMRSHGDPNQADPTIDANKVIEITLPAGYHQGVWPGREAATRVPST